MRENIGMCGWIRGTGIHLCVVVFCTCGPDAVAGRRLQSDWPVFLFPFRFFNFSIDPKTFDELKMTTRKKRPREQDGFIKKGSSLFNSDTVRSSAFLTYHLFIRYSVCLDLKSFARNFSSIFLVTWVHLVKFNPDGMVFSCAVFLSSSHVATDLIWKF